MVIQQNRVSEEAVIYRDVFGSPFLKKCLRYGILHHFMVGVSKEGFSPSRTQAQ